MKKKHLLACGIAVLALTACGRSYQGSYRGTEVISQNYGAAAPQPGQTPQATTQSAQNFSDALTLSLNDASGGSITGSYQGGSQTGTIQGTASGQGIDNVVLTISAPSYQTGGYYNQQPYYGGGYNGGYGYGQTTSATYGCGGVFVGSLALNNNRLTGTLKAQSTTSCGVTSITIDASK